MIDVIGKKTLLNGRYEVLGALSRIGQARLYKAYDLEADKFVAVKQQSPRILQTASEYLAEGEEIQYEGAWGEALSLKTRIPKVLGGGRCDDGSRYIVMDFIDGVMLHDSMVSARPFKDPAITASVIGQFCEILHVLHEGGLVHRDLKPENAMLDRQGTLWLLDLGFAIEEGMPTEFGVGTYGYIAPEQCEGREEGVTRRADVFALGCILLELTTMHLPYAGRQGRPSEEIPAIPLEIERLVPPEFHSLILRMVAMRPEDRPDVREVFDSARRFIPVQGAKPPVSRPRPDPTEHFRRYGYAL